MVVERGKIMGLLQVKCGNINVFKHLESGHTEGREEDGMIQSNRS
jgi:hypothetical protein